MILGLCGAAGCGKNAVGEILFTHHAFYQVAFADPVYGAVSAITGLPVATLQDRRVKEEVIPWLGKSPRELLQLLGTEFGRNMVKRDIWIQRAMKSVHRAAGSVVITDVRFSDEAEAIRNMGGAVVRVVRPGYGTLTAAAAGHSSEAGIDDSLVDYTITNDGTLGDLEVAVDEALTSLHAAII